MYIVGETCSGMITAPPALGLPTSLMGECNGLGDSPVSQDCLQSLSKCTDAQLVVDAGKLQLKMIATLSAKSPQLDITLPDPSVTVTAIYVTVLGQTAELLSLVSGKLRVQIAPDHLTSTFAVRLSNAAGDAIAVENATLEARGQNQTYCQSN